MRMYNTAVEEDMYRLSSEGKFVNANMLPQVEGNIRKVEAIIFGVEMLLAKLNQVQAKMTLAIPESKLDANWSSEVELLTGAIKVWRGRY